MRRQQGSVTLETAMTFPLVLIALLALFLLVRYFVVFEICQHAMYETEREMASYYYFWALSGMENLQNKTGETASKADKQLGEIAKPFVEIQHAMEGISSGFADVAGGNLTSDGVMRLGNDVESLSGNIDEAIDQVTRVLNDPAAVLRYMFQAGAGTAAQYGVNYGMQCVSLALMQKHIPGGDLKAFLVAHDIESFKANAVWNDRMHNTMSDGEIELYLKYVLNIPLLRGYKIPVVQRVVVKGWGLGD